MSLQPFHLAIPVHDIAIARAFYGQRMGCPEGRSSDVWVDFDFFGHQLVVHKAPKSAIHRTPVDGDSVPVPHFGLVMDWAGWEALGNRIRHAGLAF